jgi:flagellar hook-associated protein 2
MAGLQLSGLASGLDTATIISQLMSIEKQPRTQLTDRQNRAQARHDALADIRAQLSRLKDAAAALKSEATWGDTQSVATSDAASLGVRRTAGAASGGYEVTVTSLARADQHTFAYAAPGADTTLTVNGASVALTAGTTVDDAAKAINASDTAGVYAVAVQGRLVLSAKTTGAASAFTATGGPLTEDLTAARAGADAAYEVDGVAHTSASNVVTNGIPGVELTLKARTASPITVTVGDPGPDQEAVLGRVKAFVTAYNDTVDKIRARTTEKRVLDPQTNADKLKGVLFGDSGLNGILSSLRSTVGSLSALGITTGGASATVNADSVKGKLTIDETAVRAAIAGGPAAVKAALAGFDATVESVLDPYVQAGGVMDGRVSSSDAELRTVADALTRFDARMTAKQELLQKQFTALETVMNKNQGVQSSLASMLA